ncbi:MAG: NAD(P)H-binding protein, partial [Paludibacter sp.]
MKNITVIGATGMIGIPVTNELVKAGFNVTALVRDVEKARKILPSSINFIKGDIESVESIVSALQNAEAVYINLSTRPTDKQTKFSPEKQGLDNILKALKQSKVKRVAFLASFLARNYTGDWWVMKAKKEGIEKIKKCGIDYTLFYPSNFFENFTNGMKRANKIMVDTKINNKAWWISAEDYGKQVARSFNIELAANKEYPVQGVEAMTMKEAAEKFISSYRKEKLILASMPLGLFKVMSLFIAEMKYLVKFMDILLNNKETFEAQSTWNDLGKPTVSMQEYAKKV